MAAALLLRSLARKMARAPPAHHHPLLARGLRGSGPGASSFTQPPTMAAAAGLRSLTTKDFAKLRFGVAYVALFGSLAYLYGSLLPRLKRLEAIVEAQKQSKLDDALAVDVSTNGADTGQIMQSSDARAGRGKPPAGETMYKDLEAKMTKIELALEAAPKDKHD